VKELPFVKMHGLGNDFILLDGIAERIPNRSWQKHTVKLCSRSMGVGADGVILVTRGKGDAFRMRIFNSDGSEAEMCGNGLRCVVRLLFDRGYIKGKSCIVDAMTQSIEASIISAKKSDFKIKYCVGIPDFRTEKVPMKVKEKFFINGKIKVGRKNFVVTCLSVGNPHTVVFVDDLDFEWELVGAEIERHKLFPNRTNVEFVKTETGKRTVLKSWERGAGPTHASGRLVPLTIASPA